MADTAEESSTDGFGGTPVRGSNQSGLRKHNERMILSLLRTRGPTAKADIARQTGLSAQTASVITRALEKDGLIERCNPVRGKVGQPSIPMQLAPDGALFFGLKIGRRSADLVLVNFLGEIKGAVHVTYRYPTPDDALAFVEEAVETLTSGLTADQQRRIAGMGVAMPFYLWEWAKVIGEPPEKLADWRHRDIRSEIAARFDFPVFLENDASSACGAELVFGRRDHAPDFAHFYMGYFIGGGLVLNGHLYTGPGGNAGAFGPLVVPTPGNLERQLLTFASLSQLERMIVEAGAEAPSIWESSTAWEIEPDILARWMDEAATGLAWAARSVCAVIDFKLILIDGWLPQDVRRDLVALTARKLGELDLTGLTAPEFREGSIGPEARSLGAASLPLSHRFLSARAAF